VLPRSTLTRTRTRTNTNPNGTEANAAGRSGNARALRKQTLTKWIYHISYMYELLCFLSLPVDLPIPAPQKGSPYCKHIKYNQPYQSTSWRSKCFFRQDPSGPVSKKMKKKNFSWSIPKNFRPSSTRNNQKAHSMLTLHATSLLHLPTYQRPPLAFLAAMAFFSSLKRGVPKMLRGCASVLNT